MAKRYRYAVYRTGYQTVDVSEEERAAIEAGDVNILYSRFWLRDAIIIGSEDAISFLAEVDN